MRRMSILQILFMAASLIACSGTERAVPVVNASCPIYSAFYEQLDEEDGIFIRPMTVSLPPIAGGESDRAAELAEQFPGLDQQREFVLQRLRDDLSIDAANYFDEMEATPTLVAPCFSDGSPPTHEGTFWQAQLRQTLRSLGPESSATLVALSPVATSSDGRHAILYADFECGGLCGGGTLYVFERQDGTWTSVGTLGVWAS